MATKLTKNYLTCVVCSEVFTNPATLVCNHTFCKPCLVKFAKTQPEAMQQRSIPCPVCRRLTKATSSTKTLDEWVNELKPSHFIQGLRDGCTRTPDGEDNIKNSQPSASFCKTHIDEEIKLFCKDCNKAICLICNGTIHKQCKTVLSIREIFPEIKSSILTMKCTLDNKIIETKSVVANREAKLKTIQDITAKVATEIKTVSGIAMNIIQAKEDELLRNLEKIKNNQREEEEAKLDSDLVAIQTYQQLSASIDTALKCGSVKDICDVYEKYRQETSDEVTGVSPPDNITFKCDQENINTAVDGIGDLYSTKYADVGRETSPVPQHNIDTRIIKDRSAPDISDCVLMELDRDKILVVVDRKNNRIKSVSVQDKHAYIYSELQFDAEPFGITAISKNEAFVTIPLASEIRKISVFPQLVSRSTLSTVKAYFGIRKDGKNRLVACRDPLLGKPTVDITDMEGNLLKSIQLKSMITPRFITVTYDGTMLISEQSEPSVILISPECSIPERYLATSNIEIRKPRGITTTNTGDILLVSMDMHKVTQLSKSGDFVRDILTSADGLTKPRGICIDKNGLVYVTCGQYVKVFQFQ